MHSKSRLSPGISSLKVPPALAVIVKPTEFEYAVHFEPLGPGCGQVNFIRFEPTLAQLAPRLNCGGYRGVYWQGDGLWNTLARTMRDYRTNRPIERRPPRAAQGSVSNGTSRCRCLLSDYVLGRSLAECKLDCSKQGIRSNILMRAFIRALAGRVLGATLRGTDESI